MRHLPHSLNYTKAEVLIKELENQSFENIKPAIRELCSDNDYLLKLSGRATCAVEQYKQLVSLVDGIIIEDVMDDEKSLKEKAKNSITEIFLRLIFSMKNTSYWLIILSDFMEIYASEDKGLPKLIKILKEMSRGILSASRHLNYKHPTKRKKPLIRNLESPKEKNRGRRLAKRVSASSPLNVSENEDKDSRTSTMQNDSERIDEEYVPVNNEVTEEEEEAKSEDEQVEAASEEAVMSEMEAEKSDEELKEIAMEPSAEASESDTNEGEVNITDRSPRERQKKEEKTFGISYFKTENLFRNGVVESSKTYQNISRRKNKTSAFYRKRNSLKHNVNRNSQSSNTSLNESENSHLHSDSETVSKGPRRYRRKRTQSSNMNGVGENDGLESTSKRQRRSNSSSNRGYVSEGETRGRKRSKKDNFNVDSQIATTSSISHEQPKRRGRRAKVDFVLQKMMDDRDRNNYGLKYACVHLINVLDDPGAQHYADIIRMSHRKKKETTKLKEKQKSSREKGETNENSSGKETNEAEVEWSVLDESVSDEEEKDNNNDKENPEVNSDNDEQASESETDQEEVADDNNREQPDDEEELETNSVETKQTEERCHQDESSNHSDEPLSETKLCTESSSNHPSVSSSREESVEPHKSSSPTPDSHRASSPEVFHTEDENDAEESVRSDEEERERAPSSASESPSKYGKKGPRTPPPPMLSIPRGPRTPPTPMLSISRGPRTPPGLPQVSEDEEVANSTD